MSHVLAIAFEDEAQGPACLRTVKGLRDQGQFKINDAAVLFIVTHENFELLITALEPYKGRILQTFFDSETEE